ncbi:hypothetical protein ACFQ1S_02810 [Kibdelosporangium lantanae]|uniref:Uncharacterized protein n=1 Tax=Kibdelosporangium lantanae TaxID=1497396 RepID=A0ABW3M225_9PSEU
MPFCQAHAVVALVSRSTLFCSRPSGGAVPQHLARAGDLGL